MFKKYPGVLISLAGLAGIIITFVEGSESFSRIPLTAFFLLLFIAGILVEHFKGWVGDEVYGEVNSLGKVA